MEAFDPVAEDLIDPRSEPERLADGFVFTEGPVWDFTGRNLTFVDLAGDAMYRYDEANGCGLYRKPSSFANGLAIDREGRLVSCEHQTRRITREAAGGIEVVVDSYRGKRLNAPNDVLVASDGSIVFTDPHYGLTEGFGGPGEQELPFRGVYRVPYGSEEPELMVDDFQGPNGLALSPDETKLYVDDSELGHVRVFDVGEDWSLSGGEVLVKLPNQGEGVPDGLKVDVAGNIYCTGPGGVWICSPDGSLLGLIRFDEVAANLAWGDDDAGSMYITASTSLYRLRCRTKGHAPHRGWASATNS